MVTSKCFAKKSDRSQPIIPENMDAIALFEDI